MPIQRTTAMRLVSESEFKLVNESYPPQVGALSDKALVQRMERARKALDKYHAAAERQRSKAASGAGRSSAQSADLKDAISREKVFEEALARFERQSAKAAPASASASASDGAARGAGARKPGTPVKAQSAARSAGMKAGVNTAAQQVEGKKTASKGGAQGTSKASVKMAKKAAAKTGAKAAAPKAVKGKGGAKSTPRGRHGAMVPATTLR